MFNMYFDLFSFSVVWYTIISDIFFVLISVLYSNWLEKLRIGMEPINHYLKMLSIIQFDYIFVLWDNSISQIDPFVTPKHGSFEAWRNYKRWLVKNSVNIFLQIYIIFQINKLFLIIIKSLVRYFSRL